MLAEGLSSIQDFLIALAIPSEAPEPSKVHGSFGETRYSTADQTLSLFYNSVAFILSSVLLNHHQKKLLTSESWQLLWDGPPVCFLDVVGDEGITV